MATIARRPASCSRRPATQKGKASPSSPCSTTPTRTTRRSPRPSFEQWKENLGITVSLRNSEWKVYLSDVEQLNYQIARAGWIGDYTDPEHLPRHVGHRRRQQQHRLVERRLRRADRRGAPRNLTGAKRFADSCKDRRRGSSSSKSCRSFRSTSTSTRACSPKKVKGGWYRKRPRPAPPEIPLHRARRVGSGRKRPPVGQYLVKRLIQVPIVLWVLITISFFMMRVTPGGPFSGEKKHGRR